jgi:hypothetical protein
VLFTLSTVGSRGRLHDLCGRPPFHIEGLSVTMMSAMSKLIPALLVCLIAGCGSEGREPPEDTADLVPVKGSVTMDGEPLANATVMFIPAGGSPQLSYYATTDFSGKFSLASPLGRSGAAPGDYTVTISKFARADGTPFPPDADSADFGTGVEHIPPIYSDFARTQIRATVPQEGREDFDFPLKSK